MTSLSGAFHKGVEWVGRLLLVLTLAFLVQGCADSIPDRELTAEEKKADFLWLTSLIEANYAPLAYKEKRFDFNYGEHKKAVLEKITNSKDNAEFFELMHAFVGRFSDAHTSGYYVASQVPGRALISYLGFNAIRVGRTAVIKELLPTINPSQYPLQVGDRIVKINGLTLFDYIDKHMKRFHDLGSDQSNYTYHTNKIFNRLSMMQGVPEENEISLTVVGKDGKVRVVVMPWIKKDRFAFMQEQFMHEMQSKSGDPEFLKSVLEGKDLSSSKRLATLVLEGKNPTANGRAITLIDFNGNPIRISDLLKAYGKLKSGSHFERFQNSFKLLDQVAGWTAEEVTESSSNESAAFKRLRRERVIPLDALVIEEAKTFPAYITRAATIDKNGTLTKNTKAVGYLRIDTFSPDEFEDQVIAELEATLDKFQSHNVRDVVIDLLNNGGGSLSLVLRVAQVLSNRQIKVPDIQLALNQKWMDDLQHQAMLTKNDYLREHFKRIYEEMLEDRKAGKRISRPISLAKLFPFTLKPNASIAKPFNFVLLTNEMCASAADMFSQMFRENKFGIIIGEKTMGAGGNVVEYIQSPMSHYVVRLTESLWLYENGEYMENNGVVPDIHLPVNRYAMNKYDGVIDLGLHTAVNPKKVEHLFPKASICNEALLGKTPTEPTNQNPA